MVLEVIVEPSGHRKKCVTALPSSIPCHRAIRHTSGVIVVTSFVTKNLIYYSEYCERYEYILYDFIDLRFFSIHKKYYICFNDEKLLFKLISFTFTTIHMVPLQNVVVSLGTITMSMNINKKIDFL